MKDQFGEKYIQEWNTVKHPLPKAFNPDPPSRLGTFHVDTVEKVPSMFHPDIRDYLSYTLSIFSGLRVPADTNNVETTSNSDKDTNNTSFVNIPACFSIVKANEGYRMTFVRSFSRIFTVSPGIKQDHFTLLDVKTGRSTIPYYESKQLMNDSSSDYASTINKRNEVYDMFDNKRNFPNPYNFLEIPGQKFDDISLPLAEDEGNGYSIIHEGEKLMINRRTLGNTNTYNNPSLPEDFDSKMTKENFTQEVRHLTLGENYFGGSVFVGDSRLFGKRLPSAAVRFITRFPTVTHNNENQPTSIFQALDAVKNVGFETKALLNLAKELETSGGCITSSMKKYNNNTNVELMEAEATYNLSTQILASIVAPYTLNYAVEANSPMLIASCLRDWESRYRTFEQLLRDTPSALSKAIRKNYLIAADALFRNIQPYMIEVALTSANSKRIYGTYFDNLYFYDIAFCRGNIGMMRYLVRLGHPVSQQNIDNGIRIVFNNKIPSKVIQEEMVIENTDNNNGSSSNTLQIVEKSVPLPRNELLEILRLQGDPLDEMVQCTENMISIHAKLLSKSNNYHQNSNGHNSSTSFRGRGGAHSHPHNNNNGNHTNNHTKDGNNSTTVSSNRGRGGRGRGK